MEDQKKDLQKETPKATYNKNMAKHRDEPLSMPRNPSQPANLLAYQKKLDPDVKSSGNLATQFQTVSNMVIQGDTNVRRVTIDSNTELPEITVR